MHVSQVESYFCFHHLKKVFISFSSLIPNKPHLGFLCVSTWSEEICLQWNVKYCTLLWHIQPSLQIWNKFLQCTQGQSRTVYNTRQQTNSALQACERFSARVSRQLTQRWEALSHLNQKWAIKCLSPHIKGIDVCVQLYKCLPDTHNTLNMDVPTSFFSQISKELEVASDETHTLLSSLAPQIIYKQQSEVEALRTHTDSHYVHILPPVLSCLQQRQIKRQQDGFSLRLVSRLQMMTSFMVYLIWFGRGLICQRRECSLLVMPCVRLLRVFQLRKKKKRYEIAQVLHCVQK